MSLQAVRESTELIMAEQKSLFEQFTARAKEKHEASLSGPIESKAKNGAQEKNEVKEKSEAPKPIETSAFNIESQTESQTEVQAEDQTKVQAIEEPEREYYSVSEITQHLKDTLSNDPVLGGNLLIKGELSNVSQSARGHVYFSLKDDNASIKAVIWAGVANKLNFDLEDGTEVFVSGSIDVYAPYGTYSIVAKNIEPVGIGAIQLAYLQIKEKLEKEGLFDAEHKQDIPEFPRRIGIITSSTGAVIHDMLRVLRRKNPMVDILLHPVTVQGEGAAQSIANALEELNHPEHHLDLILLGRGGGSLEDLFCFSEEVAVRAVFDSRLPIVTGIGHEPDFALCDAAADHSASTPTAAAEYAVPDYEKLIDEFYRQRSDLIEGMQDWLLFYEQNLDQQATQMVDRFQRTLEQSESQLSERRERLLSEIEKQLHKQEQNNARQAGELNAFNPLETLARGYSVASDANGKIIQSIQEAKLGSLLKLRVSDGIIESEIKSINETPKTEGK